MFQINVSKFFKERVMKFVFWELIFVQNPSNSNFFMINVLHYFFYPEHTL